EAFPALRQARSSTDLEVVRRATDILDKLTLDRLQTLVAQGRLDQLTDFLACYDFGDHEDMRWRVAIDLDEKLNDFAMDEFPREQKYHWGYYSNKGLRNHPRRDQCQWRSGRRVDISSGDFYMIRGEEVNLKCPLRLSIIIASDSIRGDYVA